MTDLRPDGSGWARVETYLPSEGFTPELAQRLHDAGLIYAANRLVFHGVGLALGVSGNGTVDRFVVSGMSLHRSDDPEGIVYAADGQHERGLRKLATAADLAGGPARWHAFRDVLTRVEDMNRHGSEDSAGAECSRLESDLFEIHEQLEGLGLNGAINAESIRERIDVLAGRAAGSVEVDET